MPLYKMKFLFSLIVPFTFFGIHPLCAQQLLQYNVKKGDQFLVSQTANQAIVQDMNGSKHELTNLIEGDYVFKVENVSDSIITLNFKFDRFKMTSNSSIMGELLAVNTQDTVAKDDVEGKLFSGLTSATLKMKMYKNGHIKSISGTEKLVDSMVNNAGDFDDFTKELMKEAMKKEFGSKSLSDSFEQLTYIYPSKPVKVGDSWSNVYNGDLSSSNIWTLDKVNKSSYSISGKSDVAFKTNDESIKMNLKGTMVSMVVSSKSNGLISSLESTSTAKGFSTMANMADVEIPTTVSITITYKVKNYVQ